MYKKFSKSITASLIAAAMMTPTVGSIAPMRIYADNAIIDSSFDETETIWTTVSASSAKQSAVIEDGAYHITINDPVGANESNADLQFRHENLNFKKGHVYKFSFKAKSYREGMEITSQVTDAAGDKYYFVLDKDAMIMGPDMGGKWGNITALTKEYQTFEGTFVPTEDIENATWSFYYARDFGGYAGNAEEGDELWFDDISIICETCPEGTVGNGCGYSKETTEEPPVVVEPEGNIIIHSTFDETIAPWKNTESSPAHQVASIEDGAFHVKIEDSIGDDKERWDLQTRLKNLNFKAYHTYTVSFRAKANREDLELFSQICDSSGEYVYFVLDNDGMNLGDAFGGGWGKGTKLSTEYKTYTGTFTPTQDIQNVEWAFQYASGTKYGGNAEAGDEIWFDDMSIICETCHVDSVVTGCGYSKETTEEPPVVVEPEGNIIIHSTFDETIAPWKNTESSPAHQVASIEDGAFHVKIEDSIGDDKERWDLQTRLKNLNFKAYHTYTVSFRAKANREDLELFSQICDSSGEYVYFVLDNDGMNLGDAFGGGWGKGTKLSTEYKTYTGTFTPTQDIQNVEWAFQYASGTKYGGNAEAGDEIWFDDMMIFCKGCDADNAVECGYIGDPSYGCTLGDVNGDEKVLLNDSVLILQHLGNPDEYPLTEQAKLNADVDNPGSGLTNKDALRIQQYLLGIAGLDE